MRNFPVQTALSILTAGLLLAAAHLARPAFRGPDSALFASLVDFQVLGPLSRRPPAGTIRAVKAKTAPLLDDGNGALDPFYAALWRTERKEGGSVTRIVHYGDSPTTADLITGDIRSLLQRQYGDAGHGFLLIAKPWAWYQHSGVDLDGSGWQMAPASQFEKKDGLFGLGGVSFSGGASAHSRVAFQRGGETRLKVWFLRQPGGGTFAVSADGQTLGQVDTAGESTAPGFAPFEVPAPAREWQLAVDRGEVRLFGITAEKPGPGVVYDSLGLNGASITVLSRMFDAAHWTEELRERDPQLVIINYGTNEADFASFVDRQYEGELRQAIQRIRAALPGASILVMSPMDRGRRNDSGEIETMDTIPRIVEIERRVAREAGCGFFDTFTAMGGSGTMARWYGAQPRLVSADFIHPNPAGWTIVAAAFVREIEAGLNRYKMRSGVPNQSSREIR